MDAGNFSWHIFVLHDRASGSALIPFTLVGTVLGAMIMALACVGLLLYFIHHISQTISASHIADQIAEKTEGVIDELVPWPWHKDNAIGEAPIGPGPNDVALLSTPSG